MATTYATRADAPGRPVPSTSKSSTAGALLFFQLQLAGPISLRIRSSKHSDQQQIQGGMKWPIGEPRKFQWAPQLTGLNRSGRGSSFSEWSQPQEVSEVLPQVVERAIAWCSGRGASYEVAMGAIRSIAAKIGCTSETLRRWVRQAERDQGSKPGPTTEQQRIGTSNAGTQVT